MKNNSSTSQLPWKRAWITGAGRGIGAALAHALCMAGVDVYASARSEDQLERLQSDLSGAPGAIYPCPLDICDVEQVENLASDWNRENSWPDLVVLNAGTHDPFPASDFTAVRTMHLINTNLGGTLNCLEPVLRHFIQQNNGHIAVMASVAGYRGLPTAAAYGASKAALINLCEALHLDLKGTDVKLQMICPGFVRTPLTDKNEFKMPALMEPEDAADRIIEGLTGTQFEITFPKRFVYWLKLLRLLPYNWYFGLVAKATGAGKG
ncbi:SDR family NAD(P)-dependent oxidoreductase [Pontibacterium sp.]|uniref:SDR family NAD(P)-dependent oxidoreductase n=1 Tax=Pontibacterium sp. TaxID=2036026 RepID=UPI003511ABC7